MTNIFSRIVTGEENRAIFLGHWTNLTDWIYAKESTINGETDRKTVHKFKSN